VNFRETRELLASPLFLKSLLLLTFLLLFIPAVIVPLAVVGFFTFAGLISLVDVPAFADTVSCHP
jgi:hypothetical protein